MLANPLCCHSGWGQQDANRALETARAHHPAGRRRGVAAAGARTAADDTGDRVPAQRIPGRGSAQSPCPPSAEGWPKAVTLRARTSSSNTDGRKASSNGCQDSLPTWFDAKSISSLFRAVPLGRSQLRGQPPRFQSFLGWPRIPSRLGLSPVSTSRAAMPPASIFY